MPAGARARQPVFNKANEKEPTMMTAIENERVRPVREHETEPIPVKIRLLKQGLLFLVLAAGSLLAGCRMLTVN